MLPCGRPPADRGERPPGPRPGASCRHPLQPHAPGLRRPRRAPVRPPGQVAQRPGDPQHPVEAAGGQRRAPAAARPARARTSAAASGVRSTARDLAFAVSPVPARRAAAAARRRHPFCHDRRGLRTPLAVEPGRTSPRWQVHAQVDPVEQRPGQPRPVAPPFRAGCRCTRGSPRRSARARVGGQHELRAARERGRPGRMDGHAPPPAAGAGCPAPPRELGASSRNSTPGAPGTARRAGSAPPPPISAAIVAGGAATRRAAGDQRRPAARPGDRVDRRHLQRRLLVERRQQARQPLGQHRLAGARRTGQEQVVPACRGDLAAPAVPSSCPTTSPRSGPAGGGSGRSRAPAGRAGAGARRGRCR